MLSAIEQIFEFAQYWLLLLILLTQLEISRFPENEHKNCFCMKIESRKKKNKKKKKIDEWEFQWFK